MVQHARAVIIGGGVGGTSIAYHLTELGWTDIVLVDRAELTSGSTFHSAGLVGQLRSSVTLTRMMMYGAELYRRLAAETGVDPSWHEVGSLRLASTPERFEELRRQAGWAKTFGLPLDLITADEAQDRFPLMSTDGVLGAVWLPTDGWLDPSGLAQALAAGARAARRRPSGRTRGSWRSASSAGASPASPSSTRGEREEIRADVVVNAGGMFAPEIGAHGRRDRADHPDGAPVPVHRGASRASTPACRSSRDPDNLVYFREEVGGLCMGGYEHDPAPWALDGIPPDFNGKLLAPDMAALRADHGGRHPARAGDGRCRRQPGHQRPGGRSRPTTSSSSANPRSAGSSSPPGSRPTASPARAGSAARWRPGSSRANPSSTSGRWTSAGSGRPIGRSATRWRARSRTTRPTTTSTTRTRSASPAGRCGRRRRTRLLADARRVVRREVRLGAAELVRVERRGRATSRSGRAAGRASTGRPRSAPRRWRRARTAGLFDETSFAKLEVSRAGCRRRSSSGCARTSSTARSARSSTPSCSTAAAGSRRT